MLEANSDDEIVAMIKRLYRAEFREDPREEMVQNVFFTNNLC